jgi:hypothetical protein
MKRRLSFEKRAEIARSIFALAMANTGSFADDFGLIASTGREYNGDYPVGVDLVYLMGAILDNDYTAPI